MRWKEIPNTNGLYLISDDGKVFSVRSNRLLTLGLSSAGYWRAELNINGKAQKYGVHRLVAEAFIPNPNNYPVVNHKDENPKNNTVDNLEWCTYKYNSNYGNRAEKFKSKVKPKRGEENAYSKRVYQFDIDGNYIGEYGSINEAGRILQMSSITIGKCLMVS